MTLEATPLYPSWRFCSDQSGFSVESVNGVEAVALTVPWSSINNASARAVERFIPRKRFLDAV